MTALNSYRVLSTSATAGLVWVSAIVACGAVADAHDVQIKPSAAMAPVKVFDMTTTDGSRAEPTSSLPFDYKVTELLQLSDAAVRALGADGVERLERFRKFRANWDGEGARTLARDSVETFSQFFRDAGLRPNEMAVFMSREGNVMVNWIDDFGGLIELEFAGAGVSFFLGSWGEEGVATAFAVARLLKDKAQSLAA